VQLGAVSNVLNQPASREGIPWHPLAALSHAISDYHSPMQ
jgi:hypothetical protein